MADNDGLGDSDDTAWGVNNRGTKAEDEPKKKDGIWKPAKNMSFETLGLISTKANPVTRPCGFNTNGTARKVKDSCLISRMRNLAILKDTNPKLAVCITMYNEPIKLLQLTLEGVI